MSKAVQIIFCLFALIPGQLEAQVDVNLKLNHEFEGAYFQYGTIYEFNGAIIEFSRVQYYLSGFELTHDGGQTLDLPDLYVLASGNVSDYPLGQENITTLEGISFYLGVDSIRNGMNTSSWPTGHPLSAQVPSMDWSWPDGYFFWIIDGKIDSDNDSVPDQHFQLHGMGNELFKGVDPFANLNISGNEINIELFVEVSDWLREIDLYTVGIAHDGGKDNKRVRDNTNEYGVFTLNSELGIAVDEISESNIYADYTMPYAPTIYYNLGVKENTDIAVFNSLGQEVLSDPNQLSSGNYFIRKELPDGIYIITFTNKYGTEKFRFVVKN
ncbi:MAG: MbnP family protein [Fluviicola sp.]